MTNKNENLQLPTERVGIYKVGEGVLINKDSKSLNAYKKKKMKDIKIVKIENDLSSLKSDMEEIKQLLKGLSR